MTARRTRQDVQSIYPLSPMQQAMLFYLQLAPDSGVCFQQFGYTLRGKLNAAALRQSWETLTARHDVLRTEFRYGKTEQPLQIVRRHVELPWHEESLKELPVDERERRLAQYAVADRQRGFDLGRPPLSRVALFQWGEDEWRLLWSCNHLLLDGWSAALLVAELMQLYDAYVEGRTPKLPQPKPFSSYVEWLQKQSMSEAERYWRQALEGLESATPLGIERRGRRSGDEEGGSTEIPVAFSEQLTSALAARARTEGTTVASLVQAAWALLLSRYSQREDVVFGIAVSGRPADLPGVESMVGLFINTLPLRVSVPADRPLGAWLADVLRRQSEARSYEHAPLPQIHRWSGFSGPTALFESAVAFESYPRSEIAQRASRALDIEDMELLFDGLIDPVTLLLEPGDRLHGKLQFQSSRFDHGLMERVVPHLESLLTQIAHCAPETKLRDLSLLAGEDRQELALEWNDTAAPYPADEPIHTTFEQQVARSPERTAVTFEDRHLTYAELDAAANRVAAYLQSRGVRHGAFIGLCMEPSLHMVSALLGILKAGAAYLPMDPRYPHDRLAFMAEDAAVAIVLTDAESVASVPRSVPQVVVVDVELDRLAAELPAYEPAPSSASDAVYVIYTSGSTGRPKGVCVSHRSLSNHMAWMIDEFGFQASDVLVHTTSFNFDASAWQLFGPLFVGGRLVLVSRSSLRDPKRLVERIRQEGTTLLLAVPSLLEMLVQHDGVGYDGLRFLFTGGEACSAALYRDAVARFPSSFVNLYGPTECTIDATSHRVEGAVDTATVPIGLPIRNTRAYVLDGRMDVVPHGVPGELFLGGQGLAWGYHGRPGLTAERFVPDPFSPSAGERLYRTGDVVRRLPDGNLEFLGRVDHQVKIRGFRVEIGEIEAALREDPSVKQALVMVREDVPGDRKLVAYVVGDTALDSLRERLSSSLPDYMVPTGWARLDVFPLTPAGKIDRAALPAPDASPAENRAVAPPRTPAEQQMAKLWEELLGIQRVGADDDFFALGGHSQLAVKLAAMVEQVFGVPLSLATLLEDATVAGLVRSLEGISSAAEAGALVELRRGDPGRTLFLIHASGGTVMPYVHLVRHLGKPWQVYGIQLPGVDQAAKAYASLQEQLADYASVIGAAQPEGPLRLAGWSVGGLLAYELARVLRDQGREIECVAMLDASVPPEDGQELVQQVSFVAMVWMYEVAAMAGLDVEIDPEELRRLPPEQCADAAIEKLRELGAIPAESPTEAWRARFDGYLGNVQRAAESKLQSYTGRVVLLRAQERLLGRPYGWTELASQLRTIEVPGNHFSLLLPPHVATVARELRDILIGKTD